MRLSVFSSLIALAALGSLYAAHAQTPAPALTTTLTVGSSGPEVVLLQKALNNDPATRIADAGPGSPGHETDHFGQLTKAAVIRFQEKYSQDILIPAGLAAGNGRVGAFTREKLNALASKSSAPTPSAASTTSLSSGTAPADYDVKESEKIDIYAGDKLLAAVQQNMLAAINAAITSGNTAAIVMPVPKTTDVPSVVLRALSPQAGLPGSRISITASGALANTSVYFGSDHIVRTMTRDLSGNLSITIPPIAPGRYDIVLKSGSAISNTKAFVVLDPRNPPVHIESISPATTTFNGSLTINGSGFTPKNNIVVTTYQKITGVSSPDGKTLTVTLAPESLREAAKIGTGTHAVPMSLMVENDNGFSDAPKGFTMTL